MVNLRYCDRARNTLNWKDRSEPQGEAARAKGILAVEMEAAALYTFARAAGVRLLCLAHVTNTMGQAGDDFEKGEADGTRDALAALAAIIADVQAGP